MEIRLKDGRIVGGLEISDEPQQFNKDKRKYERMNETLRDMITMRVYRILRKKGVPLLEPYEFTLDDKVLNNSNTNVTSLNKNKKINNNLNPINDNFLFRKQKSWNV